MSRSKQLAGALAMFPTLISIDMFAQSGEVVETSSGSAIISIDSSDVPRARYLR